MYDPSNIDLLIVDDDDDFRRTVVRRFDRRGFQVQEASNAEEALRLMERRQFDVAVFDMVMPGQSGLELLEKSKANRSECEIIMLTGQGTIDTAVQAMKLGAYDYLTKPFPLAELEILIQKAYERRELAKENRHLKALLERNGPQWEMVGQSPAMQQVFGVLARAGASDKPILIQGESGTGKELVAQALHASSPRSAKPLVAVNCTALSSSLLESELFGHEKGAFTGAINTKPGLFEVADGGTLLIDEIAEMPPAMQVQLLRVLEDGSMRRVGSLKERRVDVRLLSATNRHIEDDVKARRFREDLYYRINVLTIELPPLRNRDGDIPLLTAHFLGRDWNIDDDAMQILEQYHWPGNVRQLINVIERGKILADSHTVQAENLPAELGCFDPAASQPSGDHPAGGACRDQLAEVERVKVIEVLKREQGNKSRAARTLGVTRRSLYRLLEKYNIHVEGPDRENSR